MQVAARLLRPPRHCSPCCSPHPASGAAVVTGAKRLRLLCTAGTDATIEDALPAVQPPTHDSVWPTAPGSTHLAPAPDAVDIASPSLTPPTGASSPAPPAAGSGASAGGILGSGTAETRGPAYWELLSSPEVEVLSRAKSASDASVLRRKGHLKEQDLFIDFIRRMHETHTCEEVMSKVERWITEHRQDPRRSRLRRMVPTIGNFFTPLKLVRRQKGVFAQYLPGWRWNRDRLACHRSFEPFLHEVWHLALLVSMVCFLRATAAHSTYSCLTWTLSSQKLAFHVSKICLF